MVESFNLPNDPYEDPDDNPEELQSSPDVPASEETPEFNPENVNTEDLRRAIRDALEDNGATSKQVEESGPSNLSYQERLTALATEKDPLGLAKVALRETLDELGKKEAEYMHSGPFEVLDPAEKLAVVRGHEEFKRKNPWLTAKEYGVYLRGLIYEAYEQVKESTPSARTEDTSNNDADEEMPLQNESAVEGSEEASVDSEETPRGVIETVSEEPQQEDLSEYALIDQTLNELRESIKSTGKEEGSKELELFDAYRTALKEGEGEEVEKARTFLSKFLQAYIDDEGARMNAEARERHGRVLDILTDQDEVMRMRKAA